MMIEIENMEAGRELDALIAERVMCLHWDESRCRVCGWPLAQKGETGCWPDNCSMRPLPKKRADAILPYSTDITAAWQVVDRLKDGCPAGVGFKLDLSYWPPDQGEQWLASFGCNNFPHRGEHVVVAEASTVTLAICRAALLAMTEVSPLQAPSLH